jgi:hypothetical protein
LRGGSDRHHRAMRHTPIYDDHGADVTAGSAGDDDGADVTVGSGGDEHGADVTDCWHCPSPTAAVHSVIGRSVMARPELTEWRID